MGNKPIDITQYFSLLNHTTSDITEVRDYIYNRSVRDLKQSTTESIMNFEIANHAFPRWNTRVGPMTDNIDALTKTIAFLHAQRRVKLYHKQCIGVIDDDILFTFEAKGKKTIRITTFYGRVRLVPMLEDFETLRKYNRKSGDNINLEQSEEVLSSQSLVVQKEVMYFQGAQQKYVLEKFLVPEGEVLYITTLEGPENGSVVEINLYNVEACDRINGSGLSALVEMGYGFFVEQYLEKSHEKKGA